VARFCPTVQIVRIARFCLYIIEKGENVSSEGFIEEASFVEGLHPASISIKALLR